jgi:diguanylate cyclase (GGDEF)-like protein
MIKYCYWPAREDETIRMANKGKAHGESTEGEGADKWRLLYEDLTAAYEELRQQCDELLMREAILNGLLEQQLLERKAQAQAIWRLTNYDSLTGLPNRAYMTERLAGELDKARQAKATGAILHIDLDDLSLINDTLGHACGDDIIGKAGEYIVAGAGGDALVARIAGDEFMVLLVGESDRERVECIADAIVRQLRRGYDSKIAISASIGIAFYPIDGETLEDVLKKADLALHAAKRSGKNTWRFGEAWSQTLAYENMVLRRELREAVEQEELSLQYQPIVDANRGCVVCFEALLRWSSSTHGAVPPSRFIPLAEESDTTIRTIGKWVLRKSCRFIRKLASMGNADIRIAVNVSPRQLAADDFVDLVRETIASEGINPNQLEIEITENVLIASLEDSTQKLSELRAAGVRLALDDFGTGYSSLTYLRSLPVGTLKIDKSFIDRIISDAGQLQFICSIINMAHVLGLTVVAEGVETEEQLEKLMECQCDFIQGYVFGCPVSEQEAISLAFSKGKLS